MHVLTLLFRLRKCFDQYNEERETPLHLAMEHKQIFRVLKLLELNAGQIIMAIDHLSM